MDTAILDRLKKLHALTTSSNEHEAALAAEKLSEMLLRHNLSMAAVEAHRIGAEARWKADDRVVGRPMLWEQSLINVICRTHDARVIADTRERTWTIVAPADRIAALWFLYDRLRAEIVRLSEDGWRSTDADDRVIFSARSWKRAFAVGCVATIAARLREMRERVIAETDSRALVTLMSDTADEQVAELIGDITTKDIKHRNMPRAAMLAGEAAGERVNLDAELPHVPRALTSGR